MRSRDFASSRVLQAKALKRRPSGARRFAVAWVLVSIVAGSALPAWAIVNVGRLPLRFGFDLVRAGDTAFVAAGTEGVHIVDVRNPGILREIARVEVPLALGLHLENDLLFVAGGRDGLGIFDVSDPGAPEERGRLIGGDPIAVAVAGGLAHLADRDAGLRTIDISDPALPVEIGTLATPGEARGVVVDGTVVYVVQLFNGLVVVDVSDPTSPVELAAIDTPGRSQTLSVSDGLAFLGNDDFLGGLRVLDVSDPAAPQEIGYAPIAAGGQTQRVGDRLFVTGFQVSVLDISDPSQPALLAAFDTPGRAVDIHVEDDLAFVLDSNAAGPAGLGAVDFSRLEAPAILSPLPGGLDIAVSEDTAYVIRSLLAPVDVRDPQDPFTHGYFPIGGDDIEVEDGIAYIASNFFGFVTADVSDPKNPRELVRFQPPISSRFPHDVEIVDDVAFIAGIGLEIADVSDPAAPERIGHLTGLSDDVRGVAVADGIAYLANWFAGLSTADVSDPTAPVFLANTPLPFHGAVVDVEVDGDIAYAATSTSSMYVYDVSDPAAPLQISTVFTGRNGIDVEVDGEIVYLAAENFGVRVFDMSDPSAPFELGGLPLGAVTIDIALSDDGRVFAANSTGESFEISLGPEYQARLPVSLDVRPLGPKNRVDPNSRARLPVALHGSESLDVRDVELASVSLGPGGAPVSWPLPRFPVDIDRDGFDDLILRFRIPELGLASGDSELCLSGRTVEGRRLAGCDEIRTIGGCRGDGGLAALVLIPLVLRRRGLSGWRM